MSWGTIAWVISAVLLFLLGFDVIADTGKVHLITVAIALIPTGLVLNGIPLAITFIKRE